ncbi:uncharacterized protein B0T15DRAFT_511211 [Chaetomium strumarium]|uniref:Uncharacterized protein n=1 Tax=Chaetomium strumarium TaxID=1170767 RepID=A0AAJ0GSW9_9PEZI|nr:hypothetical protein B0T15DRAFT_511211 [Chaetomium strumarium]
MSAARILHWFESQLDNTNIGNNGWNFQVAKAVAANSAAPTYNLVWQSRALAPSTTLSWKVEYALGWTATVPGQGVQVQIQGNWQPCNKGESFDINSRGYWEPSKGPANPDNAGWLQVGNVDYAYPGVLGLHIVVGMRNAQTNMFEPIFIDKAALGPGSSARYQPQETVSWWLEGGNLTGQVFTHTQSRSASQDFTNPSDPLTGAFEWSTSFLTVSSTWITAAGRPPQALWTPPPSAAAALDGLSLGGPPPVELQLDYASWIVTFTIPLAGAAIAAAASALYAKLKDRFKKLEVTVYGKDGSKLHVEYEFGSGMGANPGTVGFLGIPKGAVGGPADAIEKALAAMKASGEIPADETWTVTASPTLLSDDPSPSAAAAYPGNFAFRFPDGVNGHQQQQQNIVSKSPYAQAAYSGGAVVA